MYAVTGITGQVGGVVGHALIAAKQPVRAIVRDAEKGKRGRIADVKLPSPISRMLQLSRMHSMERKGSLVVMPANFDPLPGFVEAHAIAAAMQSALMAARPARVVYLSTIGAQASQSNSC